MKRVLSVLIAVLIFQLAIGSVWSGTYMLRADGTASRRPAAFSQGSSPYTVNWKVTTTGYHGINDGGTVTISGSTGAGGTGTKADAPNGTWNIVKLTDTTFILVGSTYQAGAGNGISVPAGPTSDATQCMSLATLATHTLYPDDWVFLSSLGGDYTAKLLPGYSGSSAAHPIYYSGVPSELPTKPTIARTGTSDYAAYVNAKNYLQFIGIRMTNDTANDNGVFAVSTGSKGIVWTDLDLYAPTGVAFLHGTNNTATNINCYSSTLGAGKIIFQLRASNSTVTNLNLQKTSSGYSAGIGLWILGDNNNVRSSTIGDATGTSTFGMGIVADGASNNVIGGSSTYRNYVYYNWNGLPYNAELCTGNGTPFPCCTGSRVGAGCGSAQEAGITLYKSVGANYPSNNEISYNYVKKSRRAYFEQETVAGVGNNVWKFNVCDEAPTSCFDIRYAGTTGYSYIYNNTAIHNPTSMPNIPRPALGHGYVVQNGGTRAIFKNNVCKKLPGDPVETNNQCIIVSDVSGGVTDVQLSNNLWYAVDGSQFGRLRHGTNDTSCTSLTTCTGSFSTWAAALADYTGITVKDTNAQYSDPLFVSSTDFRPTWTPTAKSPLIGTGQVIAALQGSTCYYGCKYSQGLPPSVNIGASQCIVRTAKSTPKVR